MSKPSVFCEHVNPEKTRTAVRHAVDDIQHVKRSSGCTPWNVLSWVVALGAGAVVTWRSLRSLDIPDDTSAVALSGSSASDLTTGTADRRKEDGRATNGRSEKRSWDKADSKSKEGEDDAKASAACSVKPLGPGVLAKEFWCRYQAAEVMTRSQALAFIGVLSLGPVLLFALAALGFVIHDTAQVERFVHDMVGHFLPGRQASEAANNLIAQTHIIESAHALMKGKWWAIAIGVVSLIWAAIGLFVGASDPMNVAWTVHETRSFVKLRIVALGVFVGAGILFLFSLVPSAMPSLAGRINLPFAGYLLQPGLGLELVGLLLAFVINAAMFTVIYKYLPNAKVKWKSALFGGAVAGVLWELFKKGFAVYVGHFGDYNKLYGALGGAVLLVTWIWYSCILLLAGAILCNMYQQHHHEGGITLVSAADKSARGKAA